MVGVARPGGTLNTMTYYGDGKRRRYQDNTGALDRTFLWEGENVVRQFDNIIGGTDRRYTIKPAGYGELVGGRRAPAPRPQNVSAI